MKNLVLLLSLIVIQPIATPAVKPAAHQQLTCDREHYKCWVGDHYECCPIFDAAKTQSATIKPKELPKPCPGSPNPPVCPDWPDISTCYCPKKSSS